MGCLLILTGATRRLSPGAPPTATPNTTAVRFLVTGLRPCLSLTRGEPPAEPPFSAVAMATSLLASRLTSAASAWGLGSAVSSVSSLTRDWVSRQQASQAAGRPGLRQALASAAASALSTAAPDVAGRPPQQACSIAAFEDGTRAIERVWLDPTGTVAALADSHGRVLLLDVASFTLVRVWKGYRNAQCAFLEAYDGGHSPDRPAAATGGPASTVHRRTLFLTIYAPRRGLLEVWPARRGARVALYSVGPGALLLGGVGTPVTCAEGAMASTASASGGDGAPCATAFLLDANGVVREIVPVLDDSAGYERDESKRTQWLGFGDRQWLLVQSIVLTSCRRLRDQARLRAFRRGAATLAEASSVAADTVTNLVRLLAVLEAPESRLEVRSASMDHDIAVHFPRLTYPS